MCYSPWGLKELDTIPGLDNEEGEQLSLFQVVLEPAGRTEAWQCENRP